MANNFISLAVPQSYAAQQNAQYNHTGSKYVDLKQRFNDTIAALQPMKASGVRSQLKNAIAVFQKNNPLIKCFEDLQLCVAGLTPMSDILIDITIQRILNLTWVIKFSRTSVSRRPILLNYILLMKAAIWPNSIRWALKFMPAGTPNIPQLCIGLLQ